MPPAYRPRTRQCPTMQIVVSHAQFTGPIRQSTRFVLGFVMLAP